MRSARLAAIDAQNYWMSAKIPNDQFLLYAFAGVPGDITAVIDGLRSRAALCPDLRLRILEDSRWRYPSWRDGTVERAQFEVHDAPPDWTACLDAVAALADRQLDPRVHSWRLHVFAPVGDVPRVSGPATVAVVQMAHALADGTRAAELAAWLFGRAVPVPPVVAAGRGSLVLRSVTAARTHRRLTRDLADGTTPPPPPPRPVLFTNARPAGRRYVRTLVRDRAALAQGWTVSTAALLAVGSALADIVREHGEDPARLGAEVPMRKAGIRYAHNHFGNIGVDLSPGLGPGERADRIAAAFRAARVRAGHPATVAASRSFAVVPAPLLRWGVAQFDAAARSPVVTGNTVVSSVNRGPADLSFGAAPVALTAGYPALSPMMGLTHGVHGIGDTVAVSVHASESVMSVADLDDYVARLGRALDSRS